MPKHPVARVAFVLLICCTLALIGRNLYRRWTNQELLDAVKARDLKAVRTWLNRGASPDYQVQLDPEGKKPPLSTLSLAAESLIQGPTEDTDAILCLLFRHRARRDAQLQDALLMACWSGRPGLVRGLLDLGASPNPTSSLARSPISTALDYGEARHKLPPTEIRANTREVVRILREHGARITLRDAVRIGDPALVRAQLEVGDNPNTSAPSDRSVFSAIGRPSLSLDEPMLLMAVEAGNLEVARLLLAHGADVNTLPPGGHSALHIARNNKHADLVELLQRAGATVDR